MDLPVKPVLSLCISGLILGTTVHLLSGGAFSLPQIYGILSAIIVSLGIVFFDDTKNGWLSWVIFFFVIISASLIIFSQASYYTYLFSCSQWIVLVAVLVLQGFDRAAYWLYAAFFSVFPILGLFDQVGWIFKDELSSLFIVSAMALSLAPALLSFNKKFETGIGWGLVVLQQTILRLGTIVWLYSFKPVLIDFKFPTVFSEICLVLFVFLFVLGFFFRREYSWHAFSQSAISLFIVGQSIFVSAAALPFLMLLATLSGVLSGAASEGENSRLAALENFGLGGAPFFLTLTIVYLNGVNLGSGMQGVWILSILFYGTLAWFRRMPREAGKKPIAKVVLHISVILIILAYGVSRV